MLQRSMDVFLSKLHIGASTFLCNAAKKGMDGHLSCNRLFFWVFTRGCRLQGGRRGRAFAQSWPMTSKPQLPRPAPLSRTAFRVFRDIPTRWSDNDVYGHVNNVVYYSWFDTAVNAYLMEQGALDIHEGQTIGLVIETQCNYFSSLAFPQAVQAGIRVAHLGSSSVRYEVGLFAQGESQSAAAGHFVHVYVDRQTRRPVALPQPLRAALLPLQRAEPVGE